MARAALAAIALGGLGALVMATNATSCKVCGRKLPPKGLKMSRQWANARGFCMCAIPPEPIKLCDEDTVAVFDMLTLGSNPTHDFCGVQGCYLCTPRRGSR